MQFDIVFQADYFDIKSLNHELQILLIIVNTNRLNKFYNILIGLKFGYFSLRKKKKKDLKTISVDIVLVKFIKLYK